MENPAIEYGRRGVWLPRCKTPIKVLPGGGAQKKQLYLQGHPKPSVFYCLVTGRQWIDRNETFKSRQNQWTRYLFCLPLPRCQREGLFRDKCWYSMAWGVHIWPRLRTHPFPLSPETRSQSLAFTTSNVEGNVCVGLHKSTVRKHLPWRGSRRGLKMSVINRNFL